MFPSDRNVVLLIVFCSVGVIGGDLCGDLILCMNRFLVCSPCSEVTETTVHRTQSLHRYQRHSNHGGDGGGGGKGVAYTE